MLVLRPQLVVPGVMDVFATVDHEPQRSVKFWSVVYANRPANTWIQVLIGGVGSISNNKQSSQPTREHVYPSRALHGMRVYSATYSTEDTLHFVINTGYLSLIHTCMYNLSMVSPALFWHQNNMFFGGPTRKTVQSHDRAAGLL